MPEATEEKKGFKPTFLIIGIVALAFIIFVLLAPQGENIFGPPPVGAPAPAFVLEDINGKSWDLESLRGSVVLINFWATWCPPCREEMPSLSRLSVDMVKKDSFVLLTILYQDTPDNARAYFKEMGYEMPILLDLNGKVEKKYRLSGVPETYVIDKGGIIRKHFIGPVDFDSSEARDFLTSLTEK